MIYLDCAATTIPSATAMREFIRIADSAWMNPSSRSYSNVAALELSAAREKVAKVIGADDPEQIIFTSGSTEAANTVISQRWDQIILSAIEHPCVNGSALASNCGVHYVPVGVDGVVDLSFLRRLLDTFKFHDRVLVAIMGANNEIGTIEPVEHIADIVHEFPNAKYFADNTQLWAHSEPYLDGVDFACASAHKFGGFKGSGFLYARDPHSLTPLLHGGHQESGFRAGTENVGGIVAMAAAFEETHRLGHDYATELNKTIRSLAADSGIAVNSPEVGLPNIVSLTMPDCGALEMIVALSMDEIYISAGSACTSGLLEPSRILRAISLSDKEALNTIRVSFDRKARKEDFVTLFEKINYYRRMLP